MSDLELNNKKLAIVLFNLGGPDSLSSVKPFLFNLFYDPAIIRLPNPFRFMIAKLISNRREKTAQDIYTRVGGKSPILHETEAQKEALKNELKRRLTCDFEIFITMRYWHPRSNEVARMIKKYDPSEIIILPLYPQFSSTTTGSSINDFLMALKDNNLQDKNIRTIGCYPIDQKFIEAHTSLILEHISQVKNKDNLRILFSAHGLPIKIIKAGDPYQWQVEKSVENIVKKLGINNLDYRITYQSRVGPVEWLKPSTDEEIELAGKEGKGIMIVPIAFVSEHVETLVELDIEYKHLAEKYGIEYIRVPTLSLSEKFIEFLGDLICNIENSRARICPKEFGLCICE